MTRHYDTNPLIIIMDDDVILDKDLIKNYLDVYSGLDHNAELGSRGWRIDRSLEWSKSPLMDSELNALKQVGIITGVGTYCIRPKVFNLDQLQDLSCIPKRASTMDDIWLSGHLSRQGIPKYVVTFPKRACCRFGYESAITNDNRERKHLNNIVLQHFSHDWHPNELMDAGKAAD